MSPGRFEHTGEYVAKLRGTDSDQSTFEVNYDQSRGCDVIKLPKATVFVSELGFHVQGDPETRKKIETALTPLLEERRLRAIKVDEAA